MQGSLLQSPIVFSMPSVKRAAKHVLVWLLWWLTGSQIASGLSTSGPRSTSRRDGSSPARRRKSSFARRPPRPERTAPPARPVAETIEFHPAQLTRCQEANEDAKPVDLGSTSGIQMLPSTPDGSSTIVSDGPLISNRQYFETLALDDVFPDLEFSHLFATRHDFREGLRAAMRRDVFDTTPAYANLSAKATQMMLDDDSSVQGSWQCREGRWVERRAQVTTGGTGMDNPGLRMRLLTSVLRETLGPKAPTGDKLMDTIGKLCGDKPSTHWIDIIGVKDRKLDHSWHQDTGSSVGNARTVMWGFPAEDNYEGTGVFSHVIKLEREHLAPEGHPPQQPIVFRGTVEDKFIVRPYYQQGRELVIYRDVDVIHSAPDVTYRSSVMRFM